MLIGLDCSKLKGITVEQYISNKIMIFFKNLLLVMKSNIKSASVLSLPCFVIQFSKN